MIQRSINRKKNIFKTTNHLIKDYMLIRWFHPSDQSYAIKMIWYVSFGIDASFRSSICKVACQSTFPLSRHSRYFWPLWPLFWFEVCFLKFHNLAFYVSTHLFERPFPSFLRYIQCFVRSPIKPKQNKAGYTANTSCWRVGRGGNTRSHTLYNSITTDGLTNGRTKPLIELHVRN